MPCMSKYNLFLFSDWEGRGGLTLWEGLRHIICSGRTGNENTGLVKSELQCFMKIGHRRLGSLAGQDTQGHQAHLPRAGCQRGGSW